jgi:hypothetical protein
MNGMDLTRRWQNVVDVCYSPNTEVVLHASSASANQLGHGAHLLREIANHRASIISFGITNLSTFWLVEDVPIHIKWGEIKLFKQMVGVKFDIARKTELKKKY